MFVNNLISQFLLDSIDFWVTKVDDSIPIECKWRKRCITDLFKFARERPCWALIQCRRVRVFQIQRGSQHLTKQFARGSQHAAAPSRNCNLKKIVIFCCIFLFFLLVLLVVAGLVWLECNCLAVASNTSGDWYLMHGREERSPLNWTQPTTAESIKSPAILIDRVTSSKYKNLNSRRWFRLVLLILLLSR